MLRRYWALPALALCALAGTAQATSVTFTGTSGLLSASAQFETLAGNTLKVTLANISAYDVTDPTGVLTAVFFKIPGNTQLSRTSAVLGSGSTVYFGGTDSGGVVGGEWAYRNGLDVSGANEGISSVGLGIFSKYNRFPGSNLQGPSDPDGIQYGITSKGDDPNTGNAPCTGSNALIHDTVVFTLGSLPPNFNVDDICNVSFQYGTSLCETRFPGTKEHVVPVGAVPEPLTMLGVVAGVGALGGYVRRRFA